MTRFLKYTLTGGALGFLIGHFIFDAAIPGLAIGSIAGACNASSGVDFIARVLELIYRLRH